MKKLAICSPSFCKNETLRSMAIKTFHRECKLVFSDSANELSGDELIQFLNDADIAILGKELFDKKMISQLPRLKAIAKYGVGLDNIDLDACKNSGIRVYSEPGVNAESVAEHTVGLMLAVFRNIARSDRNFHQGIWWKNGGVQLSGKKIGIIGFGASGSRVATLLKAFRCSILVNEIDSQKERAIRSAHFELASLETILKTCDAISLHVPLTSHTHHLINASHFKLLKPKAILINTSRGKVIDQQALKDALISGKLAGAGLDVFDEEPAKDPELFKIETLVATAHIAGNSEEAVLAMGRAAIDGAKDFLFNRHH